MIKIENGFLLLLELNALDDMRVKGSSIVALFPHRCDKEITGTNLILDNGHNIIVSEPMDDIIKAIGESYKQARMR